MKTVRATSSTGEDLSLEEIKEHLRVPAGYTDEDNYLRRIRSIARSVVEDETGRKLLRETWYHYIDQWPAGDSIELPYPPFAGLSSRTTGLVYWDADRSSTLLDSSTVIYMDTASLPGRVVLDDDYSWPVESLHNYNPIRLEFYCGYGDGSSSDPAIPEAIKQAELLILSDLYETRENSIVGQGYSAVSAPLSAKSLLMPYKVWKF